MRTFRNVSVSARLACCSCATLLCALSLCALPQNVHAQQSKSVPALGELPLIGRLFQTQSAAKVPMLSDVPFTDKLFRIEPKTPVQPKTPGGQDTSSQIISVEARSATLGQVIELLMDQAHLSYTLDAGLEKVPIGSLKLRKVPFDIALRAILKSASGRATYTREDGIYHIIPREKQEAEPSRVTPAPLHPTGEPAGKATVEIITPESPGADPLLISDFNGTNLYEALKLVFSKAKLNYMLDPALRSLSITAHFNRIPPRSTLELMLRSVDTPVPLTYRVENGVYQIVSKVSNTTENAKP